MIGVAVDRDTVLLPAHAGSVGSGGRNPTAAHRRGPDGWCERATSNEAEGDLPRG